MTRPPVEAAALLVDGAALLEARSARSGWPRSPMRSAPASRRPGPDPDRRADPRPRRPVRADRTGAGGHRLGDLARPARPPRRRASGRSEGCSPNPEGRSRRHGCEDAEVIAALWLYDYPRALEEAAHAIVSARSAGHLSRLPQLLQFQGFAEARSGRFAAAYAAVSEAVALAEELGQTVVWADAVNTLAGLETRLGLHDRCHEHADPRDRRVRRARLDRFRGHAMLNLALSEVALGRSERAVELVEEVHALLRGAGVRDPDEFANGCSWRRSCGSGGTTRPRRRWRRWRSSSGRGAPADDALTSGARRSSRRTPRPALFERALAIHPDYSPFELPGRASSTASGSAGWASGVARAISSGLPPSPSSGSAPTGGPSGAARELARAGAAPTIDAGTRDELTPQELQVALQVRGGRRTGRSRSALPQPEDGGVPPYADLPQLGLNARAELVERFADQVG